jgi:hypothetical protein
MRRWHAGGRWPTGSTSSPSSSSACSLLIALSVLVWSTVGLQPNIGEDLVFIEDEATALGNVIGAWFRAFFLFAGMVVLFSTSIGIMDYVSRLSASELKISFFPAARR